MFKKKKKKWRENKETTHRHSSFDVCLCVSGVFGWRCSAAAAPAGPDPSELPPPLLLSPPQTHQSEPGLLGPCGHHVSTHRHTRSNFLPALNVVSCEVYQHKHGRVWTCPLSSRRDANLQHLTVLELSDSPALSTNRSGQWHCTQISWNWAGTAYQPVTMINSHHQSLFLHWTIRQTVI